MTGPTATSSMMGDWGDMMGLPSTASGPGTAGFVAGTTEAPRVVRIVAGPGFAFTPSVVPIDAARHHLRGDRDGPDRPRVQGRPAREVVADAPDLPEIAGLQMMQTGSLTYSFSGPGPYGFACHEPGHFEAGMFGVDHPRRVSEGGGR